VCDGDGKGSLAEVLGGLTTPPKVEKTGKIKNDI
jgi:hypothetical protein